MNTKQKSHQLRMNKWTTHFSDQKASGLTIKEQYNQNNLSIHTYNYWKHALKEELAKLFPHGYNELPDEIYRQFHIIHADETPVKVMRIDNNKIKNGKKTYMWIYRNRPTEKARPIVLFDWQPSRKVDHPRDFLKNFSGTVITDGYQVYHKLGRERDDLTIGGCWIHARRPFADFMKSLKGAAHGTIFQEAYAMITEMLHIDNGFDDLPTVDRLKQRQLILTEKIDAYFAWVKLKYTQVTHNSTIGKALAYSIHQ